MSTTNPAELWLGAFVSKVGGDYEFKGFVVSVFRKVSGEIRYVVENGDRVLHIYSGKNLKLADTEATR